MLLQEIIRHINRLLTQHDYVVVPGFGGFVANYKAATIHPVTHHLSPPSKSLAFNRNLTQNDGLLVHALTHEPGMSANEARTSVDAFVKEAQSTLDRKDVLILPGIGKLFLDVEDTLQFVQSATANHLLDSFGLPELQAKPVLRGKLVDTGTAVRAIEDEEESGPIRLRPIWWAAAAILVLILGAGTLYFTIPTVHERANGWFGIGNGFDSVDVTEHSAEVTKTEMKGGLKSHMTEYWPLNIEPVPEPHPVTISTPTKRTGPLLEPYFVEANHGLPKGYFAIVGSFKHPHNAEKLKSMLKEDAQSIFIFPPTSNGFVRVGVFLSPDDQAQASTAIQHIRGDYEPDAWLVRNR